MGIRMKNKEKGFTIIEVTIVLAIAGLIMAIVFLAIPALRRNAENTQRRSDAEHMASLVNEYQSNHGGQLPTCIQAVASGSGCSNGVDVTNENFSVLAKPADNTAITAGTGTVSTASPGTTMKVDGAASCNATTGAIGSSTNANDFAISYDAKTSSGFQNVCVSG